MGHRFSADDRSPLIQALKVLLIKALLRFCSWLPLPANQALGALIGIIVSILPTESRHVTRTNLRLCFPALSESEIKALARQSLIETCKTGCEFGYIWHAPLPRVLGNIVGITGHELLSDALTARKGVIVLAPHLGSWETCGPYLTNCAPTTYLYKPPKLSQFEELMVAFRSRGGARLAPTNRKGVAMLVKALEQGEIVGILPDQEPNLEGGVFAPFFGVDALTMTLIARLAARTGAAVVTVFAKRLSAGRGFEIVFGAARAGIDSANLLEAATALNQSVEDCVRQAIPQYQWEYHRFKHQPDNTKNRLYR
ncbi:MAG: lysophospholipid acyltransferase family protein [Gammaproteobacteria bacterium]|nr:lysophospholipid acyltransferase family protein [Gammaproteobacteria bacterium]MDP2139679.1 lysophospholipid acyltransferase family protein [Gammaproteobacteria bacterium]MDP2348883.1 lysophospholipid acyltransferase family protein [Gammaproteobacteria bacterium]